MGVIMDELLGELMVLLMADDWMTRVNVSIFFAKIGWLIQNVNVHKNIFRLR